MLAVEGEDMGNRSKAGQILKDLAISVQKCTELERQFSKPATKQKVQGTRRLHLLMGVTYSNCFKSYRDLRAYLTDATKVYGKRSSP